MKITEHSIKIAINKYENGERPFPFRDARSWFLVGKNKNLYPLKYIYALVINKKPSSFNTSEAISAFSKIGAELLHQPIDKTSSFYSKVLDSIKDENGRKKRLKKSRKIPTQKLVQVAIFERNPDVVAEVLVRAGGICEHCGSKAPFNRKKDNTPYLEVHHMIQLAKGGEDTVENAEALCPNCHRMKHHG